MVLRVLFELHSIEYRQSFSCATAQAGQTCHDHEGQISLESLLKIALALGEMDKFEHLFAKTDDKLPTSLDELLDDRPRKRGRK